MLKALNATLIATLGALVLAGCAATPTESTLAQLGEIQKRQETEELNRQLALASVQGAVDNEAWAVEEYRVGPGDVLDIAVFQVEDLSLTARINGRGTVILPLLGEVEVAGRTPARIEADLETLLKKDYLHDPQVSVFVAEFRSQQIAVMGAVQEPRVHEVRRPMKMLELISLSGGLTQQAGNIIYIQLDQDNIQQSDDGTQVSTLIIDFKKALRPGGDSSVIRDLVLRGGDSVFVPEAGVVFVEGAVNKPGSYALQGEVGVLAAVAMAGGLDDDADDTKVQVFRVANASVIDVNLAAVRDNAGTDIELADGDIVVVGKDAIRAAISTLWDGFTAVFNVGFAL